MTAGDDSSGRCDSNERIRDLRDGPGNWLEILAAHLRQNGENLHDICEYVAKEAGIDAVDRAECTF
jgi:hypothetical protein